MKDWTWHKRLHQQNEGGNNPSCLFSGLTPSLQHLNSPHVDLDTTTVGSSDSNSAIQLLLFFPLFIIQLIHMSRLTEPHYCAALSHGCLWSNICMSNKWFWCICETVIPDKWRQKGKKERQTRAAGTLEGTGPVLLSSWFWFLACSTTSVKIPSENIPASLDK